MEQKLKNEQCVNPAFNKADTHLVEMIFPEHANHHGTLFAGNALRLLSKAAYIAARRFARHDVVMAACNKVSFHAPIAIGQVLTLSAKVQRVGRSSMTISVSGSTEDLKSGIPSHVLDGSFEMVAIDSAGRPEQIDATPLPHSTNLTNSTELTPCDI